MKFLGHLPFPPPPPPFYTGHNMSPWPSKKKELETTAMPMEGLQVQHPNRHLGNGTFCHSQYQMRPQKAEFPVRKILQMAQQLKDFPECVPQAFQKVTSPAVTLGSVQVSSRACRLLGPSLPLTGGPCSLVGSSWRLCEVCTEQMAPLVLADSVQTSWDSKACPWVVQSSWLSMICRNRLGWLLFLLGSTLA